PLRLEERAFVRIQAEPRHAVQDRLHRGVSRTLAIGVFHAQDELAAAATRFQPAIQSRARTADVQIAGRAGSEAGAKGHGDESLAKRKTKSRATIHAARLSCGRWNGNVIPKPNRARRCLP